jgi:hypothetical protein
MCNIPLDLQRRFEKRWAARFFRLPNAPQKDRFETQGEQFAAPSKGKRRTRSAPPRSARESAISAL